MQRSGFIATLAAVLLAGCAGQEAGQESLAPGEDFGSLPGLRAVADAWLRRELARIEEEQGTPTQLSSRTVPAERNVAAGLAKLFPKGRISSLLAESERLLPEDEFRFGPTALEKAAEFRRRYDRERLAARAALKRPERDFGIRFTDGFAARLDFIGPVRLLARLEAFCAAEALSQNDPEAAAESLGVMLRLAECLGQEKHIEPRLEAALLRAEAFRVLQALVLDRHAARADLERLRQIVVAHLKRWPDDARAWKGERALGLWAYEVVRTGRALELLTPKEIDQFREEGILEEFPAAAVRNVDQDERYYLETMRTLIEACARPYHARTDTFQALRADLHKKRSSPEFPLVAGRLLLPDVWKAQRMQARDRANWEAWAVALAAATGAEPLPFDTCPLTGSAYQVHKVDHELFVTGFGTGEEGDFPEIRVPLPQDDTSDGAGGERPG